MVPDRVRRAARLQMARPTPAPAIQNRTPPDHHTPKDQPHTDHNQDHTHLHKNTHRHCNGCEPLDWIPQVHHPIGSGEAVIPDALQYYRRGPVDGDNGSMLRAFVKVDRATKGSERLAAKLTSCARLYRYVPVVPERRPTLQEPAVQEWRRRYPLFPRVLFVLNGTGPAGVDNRISALRAGARLLPGFPYGVPVLAAPLVDLLQHDPSAAVWRPVHDPDQRVLGRSPGIGSHDARLSQTWHGSVLRFARRPSVAK